MHYIIFLLGLLMYANVAEAIDCKTPPDCASLGYSKENDPNCLDDGYMYCPFDFNFKKCVDKLTCEGFKLSSCPQNAICSECTEKSGKKFKLEACRNGYVQSGNLCNAAACPSKYETKIQSEANCPQESGWEVVYNGQSGTQKCGRCICAKTCPWTECNKGAGGTLSDICCDGNYAKCTSSCKEVTPPENATANTPCTACGVTVNTAWECNSGYIKSGDSCLRHDEGCTAVSSSFLSGGYCSSFCYLNGTRVCKTKSCPDGTKAEYRNGRLSCVSIDE